jgi:protein-disulfide isomerase
MSLFQNKIVVSAFAVAIVAGIGAAYFLTAGEPETAAAPPTTEAVASAAAADQAAASGGEEAAPAPEGSPLITPRVMGDPDAPVTLIEYSSLTCPHCAAWHRDTLPRLKETYIDTGKVKLVARDYPLNEGAALGTLFARCAAEERYFPLVDLLFEQQSSWARSQNMIQELARLASFAGMSQEDINQCLQNEELYAAILEQREVWSQTHDIGSTPTFVVNGEMIVGNQPYERFEAAIEAALN